MHIGILQADRVDPEQRARFGDYPAMFADTLRGGMEREATFEFLMHKRRPLLGAAFEPGLRSLDQPTDAGVIAGWIAAFLASGGSHG